MPSFLPLRHWGSGAIPPDEAPSVLASGGVTGGGGRGAHEEQGNEDRVAATQGGYSIFSFPFSLSFLLSGPMHGVIT